MSHQRLKVRPEQWFAAARSGDVPQLERWARAGLFEQRLDPASVNAWPGEGRPTFARLLHAPGQTALWVALRHHQVGYAIRLLELGRFPGARRGGPSGAFELLAQTQDPTLPIDRLMALLQQHGHDPNERSEKGPGALVTAAAAGNSAMVRRLLQAGATAGKNQALVMAARHARPDTVEALLEAHADPNGTDSSSNGTVLMGVTAAWGPGDDAPGSARRSVLQRLLQAGARPETAYRQPDGEPPLLARDFLPSTERSRAAYDEECARARSHRLNAALPDVASPTTARPRL